MSDFVIYGLYCVCPECSADGQGIRYVGQTRVGITQRLRNHLTPHQVNREDFPVSRWKRKHGPSNIRAQVLQELQEPEELNDAEVNWIAKMDTDCRSNPRGLNLASGGGQAGSVNESTRQKLREAHVGEKAPGSKLTWDLVRELRRKYRAQEVRLNEWAEEHGVSLTCVRRVIGNKTWVDPEYKYAPSGTRTGGAHHRTVVSDELARQVSEDRKLTGATVKELSAKYGLKKSTVYAICSGRRAGIPAVIQK